MVDYLTRLDVNCEPSRQIKELYEINIQPNPRPLLAHVDGRNPRQFFARKPPIMRMGSSLSLMVDGWSVKPERNSFTSISRGA